jgi:hypothetical protein
LRYDRRKYIRSAQGQTYSRRGSLCRIAEATGYQEAYDALKEEFAIMEALMKARAASRLSLL